MQDWIIGIGGYYGALYQLHTYWKLYIFNGSEEDVKKVYGRLYMKNHNKNTETKKTFMDIVNEDYYYDSEDDEDKLSDDERTNKYLSFISKMGNRGCDYVDGYILKNNVNINELKYDEDQELIYIDDVEFSFTKIY